MKITFVLSFVLLLNAHLKAQVRPLHTVILILENHSYSQIAGNSQAPYINSVWNDIHTARLTQSYALTHPSQPNYIMLYSGSAQGITNNNLPTALPFTAPNLGASLIQAGFTFIGYSEDLPVVGYTGESSSAYVRRHNPWVNWQDAPVNAVPAASNRPFSDFPNDFTQLPTVSIVVPNLNHDIHDGTIADCDTWIQNNLGAFIEWCKTNNGLFILTFDEDDFTASNQILTFFTGANVKPGSYDQRITHYNLLRTIEELYSLTYAGASADSLSIQNIWLTALPVHFLNFTAESSMNTTILKWQTSDEQNTKEFAVEWSIDRDQNWQIITTVPAAGNSTTARKYSYADNRPGNGVNFYRIKQIDQDNHFVYSKVLAIQIKSINPSYKFYPNPVEGLLYIASTKKENEHAVVSVFDVSGRLVFNKEIFVSVGNTTKVDLPDLRAGFYFFQINSAAEKIIQKLLIK